MTFKEILAQVIDWPQQDERVSYRALKRQFDLDDLKFELIKTKKLAVDEGGEILAWSDEAPSTTQNPQVETDSESRLQAVLPAVIAFLQHEGRVTYRTLRLACGLNHQLLADGCHELRLRRLAIDEAGEVLAWTGEVPAVLSPSFKACLSSDDSVLGSPWLMLERSSFASLSSAVTARRSRWLAIRARPLPHSPPP